MGGLVDYDYDIFDEYQSDVLADLPSIEQLIRLDDEVANKVTMPRYEGPVDSIEWRSLENYYSGLFADFITDRIQGLVDTEPIEANRDRFHGFREDIVSVNQNLPAQRAARSGVISKPAETVLLKRLRQLGFDPSALDVSHIGSGGGLYLLELFVTAAQQEALSDTALLTALLDEADSLGSMSKEAAMSRLHRPVLMVSLWDNQEEGLNEWLDNGRHGILEMATATGKTVAGIAAIAECCGVLPEDPDHEPRTDDAKIMIVAHSNAILKQWEQEIQEKLGLPMPAGQTGEQAESVSFSGGEVEFYTAQSLLPRYDRDLADQYDLVIYDEVHHYSNLDGYGAAIDRPNYRAAMGLSATIGDDGELKREQLTELLGDVVHTYGVEDARRDGIIPEFDWTVHPTPLDPYEREEWDEATESISYQFKHIRRSAATKRILRQVPVPFTELEDLGDFIRAHEAASMVFDDEEIPDEWSNLQATIHSRTWIRHRSQPKIEEAIELAKDYLEDPDQPVKLVIFAMDIDTADEIADQLGEVSDHVYRAHSQLETSSKKNNETVQRNINKFGKCENGVLVSPKMLDEGIDVPDAEVGINVAGTKTKLQLVQRMGRVLRKHGDQRPHFHHFIAMPDENYLAGLDSKEYVQELNWVRELGETIGVQPIIEEAGVDAELLERAEQRGHELWARDLLEDLEVETVQGNVNLEQLLDELTVEATEILLDELWLEGERVAQDDWEAAMEALRDSEALSVEGLQRVWWLFPLYRERPTELDELLTASLSALSEEASSTRQSQRETATNHEGTSSDGESADESTSGESDTHEQKSPSSTSEDDESREETTPSQDSDSPEPPSSESTEDESHLQVPEIVEDAGTDVQVRSSSVFDVLGVGEPPTAISRRLQVDPDTEVSLDETLLTSTGNGGLFSTGYLHQRSLQTYLLNGEGVIFLLASKRQTPEYTGQQLPELNGYRAITAITPTRALCVVGNDPANQTIQIRHEDVTSVDVQQAGQLLWKHHAIRIQTNDQTLKIPDGTDTDLEAAARYIRTAAYEERCAAGERLLECCDVVATSNGFTTVDAVLDAAKTRFQSAVDWGERYDLDTARAEAGVEFTNTCLERADRQVRFEESLTEAQRLVSDARTASINGEEDRAQQQYREAKSKLEAVLSASDEKPSSSVVEAKQLHAKLEEALASGADSSEREKKSSTETETAATEQSSKSDSQRPTRDDLINELQTLTEDLGGAPKAPEMDDQGSYSTHEYYREFGSWNDALGAAGIDRRESLLAELKRVAADIGEIPSTTQIDEHSRYSSGMYADEFGTITAAREAATFASGEDSEQESQAHDSTDESHGQPDDSATAPTPDSGPSRQALINEIQRLDDGENLVPYASEMDSDGAYKSYDCLQEFGSWDEALEAAGIDKRERLLEELRRVRDELGQLPKTTEMNHHGRVSAGMYANFFGSWTEATSLIDAREESTNETTESDPSPDTREESNSSPVLNGDRDSILTWEDIPGNSRLPSPIAVQVKEKKPTRSNRVEGRYLVADLNGKEFELKVWQKHGLNIEWDVDTWYVLREARGTVWESDGEVHRLLDSTRDLTASECETRPSTPIKR